MCVNGRLSRRPYAWIGEAIRLQGGWTPFWAALRMDWRSHSFAGWVDVLLGVPTHGLEKPFICRVGGRPSGRPYEVVGTCV
jgi:hypothetical protein